MLTALILWHEWRAAVWHAELASAELGYRLFHPGAVAWRCAMRSEFAREMHAHHRRVYRRLREVAWARTSQRAPWWTSP